MWFALRRGLVCLGLLAGLAASATAETLSYAGGEEMLGPNPSPLIDIEYVPGAQPTPPSPDVTPVTVDRTYEMEADEQGKSSLVAAVFVVGAGLLTAIVGYLLTRLPIFNRNPQQPQRNKTAISPRPPLNW